MKKEIEFLIALKGILITEIPENIDIDDILFIVDKRIKKLQIKKDGWIKKEKGIVKVAHCLKHNFAKYINVYKLANHLHMNWRTVKSHLETLEEIKFFTVPMCEVHDEIHKDD